MLRQRERQRTRAANFMKCMQVRAGTNIIKLSPYFVISYCLSLANIDSLISLL
jgi:hypothetical protein